MSMWQCPERTWSRCSNKEVSHTKWNTYINIGKRWMYILNWRIISVSKAFLSCTQAFSRTRTQTSPKRPTRWKRRCRPPVRPLTSPGIPTRFAGPLFHAWIDHCCSWSPIIRYLFLDEIQMAVSRINTTYDGMKCQPLGYWGHICVSGVNCCPWTVPRCINGIYKGEKSLWTLPSGVQMHILNARSLHRHLLCTLQIT